MKLSLTIIAKDELDNLKRIYPLVKNHIDEWVVVIPLKDKAKAFLKGKATVIEKDFTQAIEPEYIEQMKEWGLDVEQDYRLFNFAAARNASLEATTGDFILWIDADDTPLGLHNLKKYIETNPADVYNAVYDYYRDEEGNPISDHVRERVFRNNQKLSWVGAELGLIHETVLPVVGYEPLYNTIPEEIFRIQHDTDHVQDSSLRNHTALLYEYLKTNGKDPRTTYYLGIEYFNRRMYDFCIKVLLEYVKVGGSVEDRFNAWLKIAEAYHMLGNPESGRNAYLEAQKEMPHRPDSYLGLGESYHNTGDWVKAVDYLLTGLKKKMPETMQALDKMRYTFRPAVYLALSYTQLGKQDEAYQWFTRAFAMNKEHPWVKEHASLFVEAKDISDFVKGFVKMGQIAQTRYPKTLPKLADAIPDELKGQELLMDFRWRYATPKIWDNKSVVFFCSSAFEDWGPESLVKGCGGSEEAIIQLTKRLAKDWSVTVYNNCIREGVVDGVKWVRYERFNPRDMFNIFVSWRNNMHDARTAVKKYVDMHDVPDLKHYTKEAVEGLKLLVKSNYHRSLFPELPDDKFVVIPNGVDGSQFKNPKKVKNSLIWSSSYDRGLYWLLMMWPDVKKEIPNATLDIYYGWDLFDVTPWGKRKDGQQWKAQMIQLMQQDGITEHGRVGTDEIAKAYLKADVFAYPTKFWEISCITAMKAQIAKCRIITSGFAALKETVIEDEPELDMDNPEHFATFRNRLVETLKSPRDEKKLDEIAQEALKRYEWDAVADKWSREIKS